MHWKQTTVASMLLVITLKGHSSVLASLDSLEVEPVALVNITYLNGMSCPIFFGGAPLLGLLKSIYYNKLSSVYAP